MIDVVAEVIDTMRDPAARPRLRKCLPFLRSAVEGIDPREARGRLMIAAATPRGAVVLTAADGWPRIGKSKLKKGDVALALGAAIESSSDNFEGDSIVTGLSVILGRSGIEACTLDADQIREDGGQPLVVLLIQREGKTVTMLATTIALPQQVAATLH